MLATGEEAASPYLAWNDALASHFFQPASAGRPVYLFVTAELIGELGRRLGGGITEFMAAVRGGPPGVTRSGHCQRALQIATGWRAHGFAYPPYIAYLALFVLAGGHEGDFAPHAYYPRLWELLGEDGTGQPRSFDRMFQLWDDLEQWSVHDRRGELGIFEARIVGGWVHVGLPLAQTVLTEAERHALPSIFADAGLEAGTTPSSRELKRALTVFGRSGLRPRTLAALNQASGSFIEAVVDVAAGDFQAWDGEVTVGPEGSLRTRQISAGLRLCLLVDRVAGRIRARLRCRPQRDLPDRGLVLSYAPTCKLSCAEFLAGWSTPLVDVATGQPFEASAPVWSAGLSVTDAAAGWRLTLHPATVRAFAEGSVEGLPGLVEVLEVPRGHPFYLAFPVTAWPSLKPWLETECGGWRKFDINEGLPAGWIFGMVAATESDGGVRQVEPRLCFRDRLAVRLVGGVRAAAGNSYLAVAPPRVVVEGGAPEDVFYCEGRPVASESTSPRTYQLPEGLPLDTRISVEVQRGESVLWRSSIYLLSGFSWRLEAPNITLDRCGLVAADGSGVAGAIVPWEAADGLMQDLFRTPGLSGEASRVYFVGRQPREIVCWPRDPLPVWRPIWAIPFGARRGRALFCGGSLQDSGPRAPRQVSGRRGKQWKAVLWRHRHQITPPQEPELKLLWRRYRDTARDL